MSAITNTGVAIETPQAPIENSVSLELEESDIVNLDMSALTTKDGSIESYVAHRLEGCPNVDLIKLSIKCQAQSAKDYIRIGMSAMGSSASIKSLAGKKNGFKHKANDRNVGEEIEKDLVPMANVSRQIRPCSSQLPMLRLCYEKSAGMDLTLIVYMKVNGVREHNDVFTAANVVEGAGIEESEGASDE